MSAGNPVNLGKLSWIALTIVGMVVVGGLIGLGTLVLATGMHLGPIQWVGLASSPTPSPPPTASVVPAFVGGIVWHDQCASGLDGVPDPSSARQGCAAVGSPPGYRANGRLDPGEPGIPGVWVRLGVGPCPSIGLAAAQTSADGSYLFSDLQPGVYCVSVDPGDPINGSLLIPGDWTYPSVLSGQAAVTVAMEPGNSSGAVNFGWDHGFLPAPVPTPAPTPVVATPVGPGCTDKAAFVQDVTIPDNSNLLPGKAFEKIWRLRNSGTCTWNSAYGLVFASGHSLGGPSAVALSAQVPPGGTTDLKVSLVAPDANGMYRGNWLLRNASGVLFGLGEGADKPFWVQIVVGPASQTVSGTWKGEYFSNRDLKGTPALVRNDAVIDFDWKRDGSAAGLPADNFSARWTGRAQFEGGMWRFRLLVDDGARLWVDGQLVLDAWDDGSVRELTADVGLVQGEHNIRLEYYEHTQDARIRLRWERVTAPSYPEWKAEFWANRELRGSPALARNDRAVDFVWGSGAPAVGLPEDNFSARWTRTSQFEAGVYRFSARADDGFRLYLDGKLIIDEWHDSAGSSTYRTERSLSGLHILRVEYYERAGKADIRLWWERIPPTPSDTLTPTPTSSPTATPSSTPTEKHTPIPTEAPSPIGQVVYGVHEHSCSACRPSGAFLRPIPLDGPAQKLGGARVPQVRR